MESASVSTVGLSFTLLMGVLFLGLPRRFAFLPMIMGACYITLGQSLNVGGLNFYMIRILIVFAWIRIVARGEIFEIRWTSIDTAIICWIFTGVAAYTLLRMSSDALINRLGVAFNALGLYFVFRALVRDYEDIPIVIKGIAILMIPLAIAMLIENMTGKNPFYIFGGVPEFTAIRDGRLRCQGPFRHPILSGTFGATLIPILLSSWWEEGSGKKIAIVGVVAATTITVISGSSGPVMAYVFGIVGMLFWRYRLEMNRVRWAIVILLVLMHIIMEAPVWYLIARVSRVLGGTGWHRSYLIDQAISHFPEWWLLGVKYTGDWFPYSLPGNPDRSDITNQFIVEGINGGLMTMLLFIWLIVRCFRNLGLVQNVISEKPFSMRITFWALGACLFAHVVSFTAVSYFDQIIVFWYLLLAIISSASEMFGVETTSVESGEPSAETDHEQPPFYDPHCGTST